MLRVTRGFTFHSAFLLRRFLLLLILLSVTGGCGTRTAAVTALPASSPIAAAVISRTPRPRPTEQPLRPSSTATPPPTPSTTPTPSRTATPTPTAIPLPLAAMTPFPTVTPDYVVYDTKPVFLSYGGYGGDGGSNTDEYLGRGTPRLIIYGDGQLILQSGRYRERLTFLETTLTAAEMCALRQQIEATGFTQPHTTFFTQRAAGAGAGYLKIQLENTFYSFYGSEVPYLVDDLAAGVALIRDYQPPGPLRPYSPPSLFLYIEEGIGENLSPPAVWPADLPPLGELWSDRTQNVIRIGGEWVLPIFDVFSRVLAERTFQEGDATYTLVARPVLPHESPRDLGYNPDLPRDYVPVLSCAGDPALISPAVPTATPTLTAPAAGLGGQGRLLFVSGSYQDQEIFVSEADGSNRLRLTNNLFSDSEPVWSPDGRTIAFVSDRSDNLDIFVMSADGTNVRQLTDHEYDDYSPTWSPDGSKIAFISDRDGGWQESELYVMNADGTEQARLTANDTRDLHPVWSPDGRTIAFVSELYFQAAVRAGPAPP